MARLFTMPDNDIEFMLQEISKINMLWHENPKFLDNFKKVAPTLKRLYVKWCTRYTFTSRSQPWNRYATCPYIVWWMYMYIHNSLHDALPLLYVL